MNSNIIILTGLSLISLGVYYQYYYYKDPQKQAEINAKKSVKYTNIDNLIAANTNSKYLSLDENNNENINNYNSSNFSSYMYEDDNLNIKEDDKPKKNGGYFNNKYY